MHILKSIRTKKGLPIAAVAVRARMGTGTIIMIERHGHNPRPETKQRLAAALGVSVESIWPTSEERQRA
ncbi:MAG: helix-turn-helix transcriptional regulator [Nitrospira sp.]|nr:helix-turn-helix transcriptional regulator [Nitrospira sp.]